MYAHKITGFTGPGDVVWEPAEEPSLSGEAGVLVDVVAAGVSFADLLQTRGQYQIKVPVPYVPGMDAAGVVRLGLFAGQRVVVLASSGCWQEVVSAPAERVLPLPDGMGFAGGVRSLAARGRLLVVGFGGGEIPVVKVNGLLLGNTGVLGVAFREFFEARPEVVGELWSFFVGLWQAGKLGEPPVMAFPFADA